MTLSSSQDVVISDDIITEYAAGSLSPAKHIMVACQSEISETVAKRVAFTENIAASMLEDIETKSLSPLFMGNVLSSLPPQESANVNKMDDPIEGLAPKSLRHMLGKTKEGDRLYLLKAKGGMRMPDHSHTGEEWSLILTGSYTVGGTRFTRGDLHIEDETETHAPHIDGGRSRCRAGCRNWFSGLLGYKPSCHKLKNYILKVHVYIYAAHNGSFCNN